MKKKKKSAWTNILTRFVFRCYIGSHFFYFAIKSFTFRFFISHSIAFWWKDSSRVSRSQCMYVCVCVCCQYAESIYKPGSKYSSLVEEKREKQIKYFSTFAIWIVMVQCLYCYLIPPRLLIRIFNFRVERFCLWIANEKNKPRVNEFGMQISNWNFVHFCILCKWFWLLLVHFKWENILSIQRIQHVNKSQSILRIHIQ